MVSAAKVPRFKAGYYLHIKVSQKVCGHEREVIYNIGEHKYMAGCLQNEMRHDSDGRKIVEYAFMSPDNARVAIEEALEIDTRGKHS